MGIFLNIVHGIVNRNVLGFLWVIHHDPASGTAGDVICI